MEKQYLPISDPAAIINALVAQLTDAQMQIEYARKTNEAMTLENTTLRDETKRLQEDIAKNERARRLEL